MVVERGPATFILVTFFPKNLATLIQLKFASEALEIVS
jgi:hypothetical protein